MSIEFRIEDISWYNGSLDRFHLDKSRCRLEKVRLLSLLGRFPVLYREVNSNCKRKLINYRDASIQWNRMKDRCLLVRLYDLLAVAKLVVFSQKRTSDIKYDR